MAIFESSLEKIRFNNKLSNKDIKTNLIQITNYQNDIGDETFLDIKFELDVIHKGQFLKTKNFLNHDGKSPIFNNIDSIKNIVDLFKKQNFKHKEIFNNIERVVLQVIAEDKLFYNNIINNFYSNFYEEPKKYAFDLLANFILSLNTNLISTPYTKKLSKSLFIENEDNENENLLNLINSFIKKDINLDNTVDDNQSLFFLKNFLSFNFLDIHNINLTQNVNKFLISNGNKPLSIMSINAIKNNIKNCALDEMSSNSLLYGFFSNIELASTKYNFTNLTNLPFTEDDITKEFIPFKYTKNFDLFTNINLLNFTKRYTGIISQASLQNENEKNDNLINNIKPFININNCLYSNNALYNYDFNYITKINDNLKVEVNNRPNFLTHTVFHKKLNYTAYGISSLIQKGKLDMLQALNLITNNLNSKRIILLKNSISISNELLSNPNLNLNYHPPRKFFTDFVADNLEFYNSLNNDGKGIFNNTLAIFNDRNNNFFANVLKNRNICNNIVKKFKKAYYKNTDFYNKFKTAFNYNKTEIGKLESFDSYFISNLENRQITNINVSEASRKLKEKETIDISEIKKYTKNNYIIGDQNIESDSNLNEILTNQYLEENIDIDFIDIKENLRNEKETLEQIAEKYYSNDLGIFKNTSTFFSSIKDICSNNISFLTENNSNVDILDNASILWIFNDNNKVYTQEQKNQFLDELTTNLITFIIIDNLNTNNNNLKNSFKNNILNLLSINNNNNIMSLFPFFIFTSKNYQNDSQKNFFKSISYFNSIKNINEYETNGLFSHFLYDENHPFTVSQLDKINKFSEMSFDDKISLKKINIAGYHAIEKKSESNRFTGHKVVFIPELIINQSRNYEIKNNIFLHVDDAIQVQGSFNDYSYSITLKELIPVYSLLQTFNFSNRNIQNNLFFNVISNFKDLISKNFIVNNNTAIDQINVIIKQHDDVFLAVKNTLKVISDIYCDMCNSLQSYTNICNRIVQSNHANIRTYNFDADNINIKYSDSNTISIPGRGENYFLTKAMLLSQNIIEENVGLNYRSYTNTNRIWTNDQYLTLKNDQNRNFAIDKFYYFLNKIFDIDFIHIQNIVKHICSQNIINENQNQYITLKEYLKNDSTLTESNIDGYTVYSTQQMDNHFPGYTNLKKKYDQKVSSNINNEPIWTFNNPFNLFQNTYNPFDIFNIYNKNMTELISDFKTSYSTNFKQYEFECTSPTIINLINYFNIWNGYSEDNLISYNNSDGLNDYKYVNQIIFSGQDKTSGVIRTRLIINPNQNESRAETIPIIVNEDSFYDFDRSVSIDTSYLDNKNDEIIDPLINTNVIFNNLVNSSFKKSDEYRMYTNSSSSNINNIKKSSGINEYFSHQSNYLNFSVDATNVLSNIKYVDIMHNWYNHIYHGLVINDISLSLSFDFLNFYYSRYIDTIKNNYNILKTDRSKKINNIDINSVNTFFKGQLINENNIKKILNFNKNNQLLQDNYEKSLMKYKSSKNIIDLMKNEGLINNSSNNYLKMKNVFEKVNNVNHGNGEIIYSYLNDFYINAKQKKQNSAQEINQLHNPVNQSVYTVNNQAKELLGSHILSIGIDHDIKLNKNDIIIIQIDLIDHDFPEIIWEPKVFEYYSSFDDINNQFIQSLNLNDNNLEIKIKNRWDLLDANSSFKDKMIKNESYNYNSDDVNLTNNIYSNTYNSNGNTIISTLNPIFYRWYNHNNDNDIIEIDILKDKFFDDIIRRVLTNDEIQKINNDLLRRCIHNQILNFRIKKGLKLISGIDIDSFYKNIDFNKKIILKEVYDIFVTNTHQNNDFEYFEINYVDFIRNIDLTPTNINNYSFYTASLSEDHRINVFIKFLSDFSKAIIEDFCFMNNGNNLFQKIYNIAVNPKDFIVAGLEGSINIIPTNSDLIFEKIIYEQENRFFDEIGTEPNLILRKLSEYTTDRDNITYYKVKLNNTNKTAYIPKNISYRITTKILK